MRKFVGKTGLILSALLIVLCLASAAAASDITIRGVVTDNAGKPIRGAMSRRRREF